jgi:hypothetical protein
MLEPRAANTAENVRFTGELLYRNGGHPRNIVLATKPFMQRRVWATMAVEWPEVPASLASERMTLDEYFTEDLPPEKVIPIMLGDLQRVWIYGRRGWSAAQIVPPEFSSRLPEPPPRESPSRHRPLAIPPVTRRSMKLGDAWLQVPEAAIWEGAATTKHPEGRDGRYVTGWQSINPPRPICCGLSTNYDVEGVLRNVIDVAPTHRAALSIVLSAVRLFPCCSRCSPNRVGRCGCCAAAI